jgi:hypothetical protein
MTNFDDQCDEAARDEEELRSKPAPGNRPLLLAAVGLALMVGGYVAASYVPAAAQHAETARRLQELRTLAEQRREAGMDDGLSERLNRVAPPWRNPPYQMAGRLAIYAGLFLFVLAVVQMYRSSPPPTKDIDDGE